MAGTDLDARHATLAPGAGVDHLPFRFKGMPGATIMGIHLAKAMIHIHTRRDTPERVNPDLVSRCAEKDLYDLLWLLDAFSDLKLASLVEQGAEIDGGLTAESALVSLVSASLSEGACDFSTTEDAAAVYGRILAFRESLAQSLEKLARAEPPGAFGDLVRRLKT